MAYFNHAFKKVFLPSSVETGANQKGIDLTNQELAVMNPNSNLSVATAGLGATGQPYYLAQGPYVSSDTLGNGLTPHGGYKETVKSKIINPRYISMLGYMFNQELQQNVVKLVGQYNCFPCGSLGMIRVDLKGSPALRFMSHNMYKIFSANNMCCKTGESYQDPTWVFANIADEINGDDYWKQFVTATLDTSTDGGGSWTAVTASSDSFVTGYNSGSPLSTITASNQGRLVLTAAYSDTTFGNCSFDPRDFSSTNVIPIEIANVDVLDETGDVCVTCGTSTETQAPLMGIGHGEEVLRKMILSESYRQHHFNNGAKNSIRMREIEQGDELVSKVTRSSTLYNSYYIQHHVPRFNNPTGVFDNDQYLIELIGLSDAAGAVGGGGTTSAAINTLMGQIETWQDAVNGADSVAYQNLQSWSSIS
jgi:hypothetical protein